LKPHLGAEGLHQPPPIHQSGQAVGDRDPLELLPALAEPAHHVIEDLGEIGDFAPTGHRQVYIEVTGGNLGRAFAQTLQRTDDDQGEDVGQSTHHHQQAYHHEDGHVAEPGHLLEGFLEWQRCDHVSAQPGNLLQCTQHLPAIRRGELHRVA
jgi:hypothetical protein